MRKFWWIKLLLIIGFFVSWYLTDNIHLIMGNRLGNLYFMVYMFILGIIFIDSFAYRAADGTW